MMDHALELNKELQKKVKEELQRIEEQLQANQKMQQRVELLIKEAAIVRKTARCRIATFYPMLNKSVCVTTFIHYLSASQWLVNLLFLCVFFVQRPNDNDDVVVKHAHGVTPLYAYGKCLYSVTSDFLAMKYMYDMYI